MPGPATLIAPADGSTLPQPVAPSQWTFSWSGRTGPCYSTITVAGPGGRRLGSGYIPWQDAQGYSYTYSTTEPLPDDALGPWAWYVEIHCPGGTSRSLTRAFRVAAGPPAPTTPAVTPPSPTPTRGTPTPVPTQPGLIIRGTVRREDDTGLANVAILRAFASYTGQIVATTGPDGSYVSAFQYIPGDETVRVWAEAPGYAFVPGSSTWWENGQYIWRHYYGREDHTLDFVASRVSTPSPTPAVNPTTTPSITPTSIPGPPALIESAEGAKLP